MKVLTLSTSIEVTFIVLWAVETNLETEPNSVTKIGNQTRIIIANPNKFLSWQIRHDLHLKQAI